MQLAAIKMSKSITNTQNTFVRDDSTESTVSKAIFHLVDQKDRKGTTQITLPTKSVYSPGLHWHETHTEFFRVIQGRVIIVRNGIEIEVGPDDGQVRIDKFVVHNFWRADRDRPDDQKDSEDVVTEEWTDPADGLKHVFFRNIFSTIDDQQYWGRWLSIQALFVASHNDEFVEVISGRLSHTATHALYLLVNLAGLVLDLKSWYPEYTPEDLRSVAQYGSKRSKNE